jgi:hypothetical protein
MGCSVTGANNDNIYGVIKYLHETNAVEMGAFYKLEPDDGRFG